jgi:hypothetical protein
MDINHDEIQELQEKLILIYKFVNQEKLYDKFFFEGEKNQKPLKYQNKLLNNLLKLEDVDEFLKNCILELEELKGIKKLDEISFGEIMKEQDMGLLYRKYNIKDIYDVESLDVEHLLDYF